MNTEAFANSDKYEGSIEINDLWLVFKINKKFYAISSEFVSSILILSDNITPLPEAPNYIKGICTLRGNVLTFVDMRTMLGFTSLDDEYNIFVEMLEQRKQDHLNWVEELERTVAENEKFNMSTDPHKCAFGIWYDGFHTDRSSVDFHMKKVDEPHQKLHACALETLNCNQNHNECKREECIKIVLKRAEQEYIPLVVKILDEAKDVFKSSYQEIGIVLEKNGNRLGIVVDEVFSVENLSCKIYGENGMSNINKMKYFKGIGESHNVMGMILLIDEIELFKKVNFDGSEEFINL